MCADTDPDRPGDIDLVRRYQAELVDFGRLALGEVDLDALLQAATERIAAVTGISHVKILQPDPPTGKLLIVAGVGWHPGVVGHVRLGTDMRSPPGHCFRTGEPVEISDVASDPHHEWSDVLREHGIVALLNVPIRTEATSFGVLEVDRTVIHHFSRDKRQFLLAVAALLAAAIDRRQAEDARRAAIMTAAAEREVLLRELQHRVGNNLQALYALLHRNQQAAKTEHSRALIGDALKRVETMMDAHAQLASGHARGEVPIAPFLARVCAALAPPGPHVRIETEFDECDVPMKHAVTIGMIVNEIVTNSLKHAFPPDLAGTVRIEFRTDGTQTHGEVVVSDTGRGMGPSRPGGQGLTLIRSLAAQLGGTVFRDEPVTGGTRYRMAFPLPPK